jgi:hypothetical protein
VLIKIAPWKRMTLAKLIPRAAGLAIISLIPIFNIFLITLIPFFKEVDAAVKRANLANEDQEIEFTQAYIKTRVIRHLSKIFKFDRS